MTPEELAGELGGGRLRPAYLLAGAEPLLRDEALAALRRAVLAGAPEDFNLDRLEGAATAPAALLDSVRMLPVMSERRLVWLREPEVARGAGRGLADALADVVPQVPAGTVLVVTAAKVDRRARWVKAFSEPAAVVDCAPPAGAAALARFVAAEARRQALTLEPGVGELLAERVGPHLLQIRAELEKAALLAAPATRIGRAHVEATVTDSAEEPIWDLTDAIGEGRTALALPILARMLRAGMPAPVLLGSLASHFRKLLRVATGGAVAGPPFVVRKLEKQARRYGAARLGAALRNIHDADLALKGEGHLPPDLALERLVLVLAS